MVAKAYWRCTSGHYFSGEACPLDGWSSPESLELARATRSIASRGGNISLAELQRAGVSSGALNRAIVIEFGSPLAVFDTLVPEGYVINNQYRRMRELGLDFK
jgi:hypothetical protein